MAIFDLSNTKQALNKTDPGLVTFGSFVASSTTQWSWFTPGQHQINSFGSNLTFDNSGRATSGIITEIGIDLGGNDFNFPDVTITGISVAASTLDDSPESFWRVLDGDDTITGPLKANVGMVDMSTIFGDGRTARVGISTGGNDVFDAGDAFVTVIGDVETVGGALVNSAAVDYRGGNDTISGRVTDQYQIVFGDANGVKAWGRLTGGNDTMTVRSTADLSQLVGDAYSVAGSGEHIAEVFGGADNLQADVNSLSWMVGDVFNQFDYTFVKGGFDYLAGSNKKDTLTGDVFSFSGGELIGGNDLIYGNFGDDIIVGDAYIANGAKLTGGYDFLHGGSGNDQIYGENALGAPTILIGGNDQLFGDEGNDSLWGQSGHDLLDGGAGADTMYGGEGNDTYVTDSFVDFVFEGGNQGIDTVRTFLGDVLLGDNVENLTFIGTGGFTGRGNALNNIIIGGTEVDTLDGGTGNDRLDGLGGNDTFFGGFGNDRIDGGAGIDIIDYSAAGGSLYIDLRVVTQANTGGLGTDVITSIETVIGGDFADVLVGSVGANTLYGGAGADAISAVEGDDIVFGGTGDDYVAGLSGNDTLRGDAGSDVMDGGNGIDFLLGGADDDYLIGGADNDTIFGSDAKSKVGDIGDRWLGGDGGDDFIYGDLGTDRLSGGDGNDTLTGGESFDYMTGEAGVDTFVYNAVSDGSISEQIGDWQGGVDKLRIDASAFGGGLVAGALAANQLVMGTVANQAFGQFLYNAGNGVLYWDADGTGAGSAVAFTRLFTSAFTLPPALIAVTDFDIVV
jgi:Ca2+-binding RTX toxin-like protein